MASAIVEEDALTRFTLADIDESEKTALLFGLCKSTILRFFKQYKQCRENYDAIPIESRGPCDSLETFETWFTATYQKSKINGAFDAIPGVIWDCDDMAVRYGAMLGLSSNTAVAHQEITDIWLWRIRRIVSDLNKDVDITRFKLPTVVLSEQPNGTATTHRHVKLHFSFTS